MSRRNLSLLAAAALAALLATAAIAAAKPVVPLSGPFSGSTSQKGAVSIAVSKAGAARKVDFKVLPMQFTCTYQGTPVPVPIGISTEQFKEGGKGRPLPVKNGKFSYKGPLYIGTGSQPTIDISGTFKSPKKLVGKASLTSFTAEVAPGTEAPCEGATISFNAKHG